MKRSAWLRLLLLMVQEMFFLGESSPMRSSGSLLLPMTDRDGILLISLNWLSEQEGMESRSSIVYKIEAIRGILFDGGWITLLISSFGAYIAS